ncbi:unnamed protein product [Parajaminaea phylloscopi]
MEAELAPKPSALAIDASQSCQALLELLGVQGTIDSLPSEARTTVQQWADGQGSSRLSCSYLLDTLAQLLSFPELALPVATHFRPLLPDIAARLLSSSPAATATWQSEETCNALYVLSTLLLPFPEVYQHLLHLLSAPSLRSQPCHLRISESQDGLGRLLLSFARTLHAAPALASLVAQQLPQVTLQSVFADSERYNAATRLLAIRIAAVIGNLSEHARQELELRYIGTAAVHNIGGVLHYRGLTSSTVPASPLDASFVVPPKQQPALNCLSQALRQNLPVLISGPASSGKLSMLSYMSSVLHPTEGSSESPLVTLQLGDHSSLDAKALVGSYTSSTKTPGTFEWVEGALTRALRRGKWLVLKDIDKATGEILSILKPLVEALNPLKPVGTLPELDLGVRGKVRAGRSFRMFAVRSVTPIKAKTEHAAYPPPSFLGSKHWSQVNIPALGLDDVAAIIRGSVPRLAPAVGMPAHEDVFSRVLTAWANLAQTTLGPSSSGQGKAGTLRTPTLRDLLKWAKRMDALIDIDGGVAILSDQRKKERAFLEGVEILLGSHPSLTLAAQDLSASAWFASSTALQALAHAFDITAERAMFKVTGEQRRIMLKGKKDVLQASAAKGTTLQVGRFELPRAQSASPSVAATNFAETHPTNLLLERIAGCVAMSEPVLLVGETGTGKTTTVQHLASQLGHSLVALNLSQQTEASDLLGSFKPLDPRVPATSLHNSWSDLFEETFSAKRNARFVELERKALQSGKWARLVSLWQESIRMANERRERKLRQLDDARNSEGAVPLASAAKPLKKRKTERGSTPASPSSLDEELEREAALHRSWQLFEAQASDFASQHATKKRNFVFSFVEGPLVRALRDGSWVLLDEVNLAASETLDSLTALLASSNSSLTLFERGDIEPVPRHPNFRLFACMNPATDVGKKDLPLNLRSKFTELYVQSPDADLQALRQIVEKYIGHLARGERDQSTIQDVAECYRSIRKMAADHLLADGANQRPHYSIRTLSRALTFAAEQAGRFGLRRAVWEGFVMAFTMLLDDKSAQLVRQALDRLIMSRAINSKKAASFVPPAPRDATDGSHVQIGPFWLRAGPHTLDAAPEYILTPSVQNKLVGLARAVLARKSPVLIQGPTSAGKTSAVEYLARRTGHRFVRINNHEHTDVQEYLGSYASDPDSGRLVFHEGLLVKALRAGDWIVLDELNLAPTDVLEALNRLLDDNRELVIPETGEVVRPHPHFMLFATQNPPGLYAGRKVLSRAFRNRFVELHFDDVPQPELETILTKRCAIAPSYAAKIVAVFVELQRRRQAGRIFDAKHAFVTLRDLFRWGRRDAMGYQQLAENGYMLIAERARRDDDKAVVKEVIQDVMRVQIDQTLLYDLRGAGRQVVAQCLGEHTVDAVIASCEASGIVWTAAMSRLLCLVALSLHYDEPVLLVGETGAGKTSVCEVLARAFGQELFSVSCHQNTDTADLLGGQRPLRNRATLQAQARARAVAVLSSLETKGLASTPTESDHADLDQLASLLDKANSRVKGDLALSSEVQNALLSIRQASLLFEWRDGPLVEAMRKGGHLLLDEISLADDSVLERLNSVLEPGRTLVLAEKSGSSTKSNGSLDSAQIQAAQGFQVVATMNPGGDYGKKELSPALRNRFTEIWVPQVDDAQDILAIFDAKWNRVELRTFGPKILDFVGWFAGQIGGRDQAGIGLRDLLSWVTFINSTTSSDTLSEDVAFAHGALLAFVDGIGAMSATSSMTTLGLKHLRTKCHEKIQQLSESPLHAGVFSPAGHLSLQDDDSRFGLGPFSIEKGATDGVAGSSDFSFVAETTAMNAMKVLRALYVPNKAILLEGSPGAGKTSLISALAHASRHRLTRINLSDQTELIDLFGADLPVEGGGPGEFAWKDAAFLRAMQNGEWVLLDEMNLASQSVLEGLNSCLDHRGSVFISELGRAFDKHPDFRLFAAQNPQAQGGGRKGLPKSFLNRFTKVHIDELVAGDILTICGHLYPGFNRDELELMIRFNAALHEEIMVKHSFGRHGAPWEFNLRDLLRWLVMVHSDLGLNWAHRPIDHLAGLYLQRFRSQADRYAAAAIFEGIFGQAVQPDSRPWPSITPRHAQFGHALIHRRSNNSVLAPTQKFALLHRQLPALESLADCVQLQWLCILVGPSGSGKTTLARMLANIAGRPLEEMRMNSGVDTMDVLGTFEQMDPKRPLRRALERVQEHLQVLQKQALLGLVDPIAWQDSHTCVASALSALDDGDGVAKVLGIVIASLDRLVTSMPLEGELTASLKTLTDSLRRSDGSQENAAGRFEWHDGPLLRAMQEGRWLLLDDANLCSASVLDRLNSLFEPGGELVLSERGVVDGEIPVIKAHKDFRLFMAVDPQHGELSRAMRNRGLEIYIPAGEKVPSESAALATYADVPDNDQALGATLLADSKLAQAVLASTVIVRAHSEAPSPFSRAIELFLASTVALGTIPILSHLVEGSARDTVVQVYTYLHRMNVQPAIDVSREAHHTQHGLLSAFLSEQPADAGTNPLLWSDEIESSVSLRSGLQVACTALVMIRTLHGLQRAEAVDVPSIVSRAAALVLQGDSATSSRRSGSAEEELAAVLRLAMSLQSTVQRYAFLPNTSVSVLTMLQSVIDQLSYLLQHCASQADFDYSLAHTVLGNVQSVRKRLDDLDPVITADWPSTAQHSIRLTSGHAMQPIWELCMPICAFSDAAVPSARLRREIRKAHGQINRDVISAAIDLGATLSLPQKTWTVTQKGELLSMADKVTRQLGAGQRSHQAVTSGSPRWKILSLAQLQIWLTSLEREHAATSTAVNEFVQQAVDSEHYPLINAVTIRKTAWLRQEGQPAPKQSLDDFFSWAQPLFDFADFEELLQPFMLRNAMFPSTASRISLSGLIEHRRETSKMARLASASQTALATPRHVALHLELRRFASTLVASLDDFVGSREDDKAATQTLHRVQAEIERIHASGSKDLSLSAQAYIAIASDLLKLYLPNVPLDPLALLRAREAFARSQLEELVRQEALWASAEQATNGRNDSPAIAAMRVKIDQAKADYQAASVKTAVERQPDVSRLNKFFNDVQIFTTQILDSSRLADLQRCLLNDAHLETQATAREESLQSSLNSLRHRLNNEYTDLQDLCAPLSKVVDLFQIGFRCLRWTQSHRLAPSRGCRHAKLIDALVQFPATRSGEAFRSSELPIKVKQSTSESSMASDMLLTVLSTIAYDMRADRPRQDTLKTLSRTYDQLFFIWTADREREAQAAEEENNLFKSRNSVNMDVPDDDEALETEFHELFPEYSDVMDADDSRTTTSKSGPKMPPTSLLQPHHQSSLWSLHMAIFGNSQIHDMSKVLQQRRQDLVKALLKRSYGTAMSEELDRASAAFQLSALGTEVGIGEPHKSSASNFYLDPDTKETAKATLIVQSLRERLTQLIDEWSEQMVLQHLRDRCDAILALDSASPVAKILAALEQLLVHTEDWEGYANSSNSLTLHRNRISDQIIAWRRLELAGWSKLLETQSLQFRQSVSEWWFRIYEVAIRGMQSATAESEVSGAAHLRSLVELLDQFVRSSTLGDFEARLELLQSFAKYLRELLSYAPEHDVAGLDGVARILDNVVGFYDQFRSHVADSFLKQRSKIEKDIRGFIQLASWKDVNIHALKQSAQKSHRRLHKSMRQFRAVLRQPVDPILASVTESKQRYAQLPDELSFRQGAEVNPPGSNVGGAGASLAEFPSSNTSSGDHRPRHLQNLAKTFEVLSKRNGLALQRISRSIQSDAIDDLAGVIIERSRDLAKATPAFAKEDNAKAIKNLTNQKRKAWTDLLKEMRRIGLSAFVNPDVAQRNQDLSLVFGLPQLKSDADGSTNQALNRYFYRLVSLLPRMRDSLHSNKGDVPSAELQRGVSYCEHAISILFKERAQIAALQRESTTLKVICERLDLVHMPEARIMPCPQGAATSVSALGDLCGRVLSTLEEIENKSAVHDKLSPHGGSNVEAFRSDLHLRREKLAPIVGRLVDLASVLQVTAEVFWTSEEEILVRECVAFLSELSTMLRQAAITHPSLSALCQPASDWLSQQQRHLSILDHEHPSSLDSASSSELSDRLISSILLVAQNIDEVPLSSVEGEALSLGDKAITNDLEALHAISVQSRCSEIRSQVDNLLETIATQRHSFQEAAVDLRRIAPFVSLYAKQVASYAELSARWQRSLLKLTYVMASTVTSLSAHGFCKPPEQDDGGDGEDTAEDQELEGGTGLGDGSGAKDITDQLEDDENIEELQKEDDGDNESGEKGQTEREKNAREADNDIDGDLEEVSADEGDESAQEDGAEQEEPDEHVGDVDPLDPNAVDEKIWSGDNDEDENKPDEGGKDETTKDMPGQEGEEDSVAKENGRDDSKNRNENASDRKDGKQDEHAPEENSENAEPDDSAEPDIEPDEDDGKEQEGTGRQLGEDVNEAENLDIDDDLKMSDQEAEGSDGGDDLSDLDLPQDGLDADEHPDDVPIDGLDADETTRKAEMEVDDGPADDANDAEAEVDRNAGEDAMDDDAEPKLDDEQESREDLRGVDDLDSRQGADPGSEETETGDGPDQPSSGDISASANQAQGAEAQQGRQTQRSQATADQGNTMPDNSGEADADAEPNSGNGDTGGKDSDAQQESVESQAQESGGDAQQESNPVRSLGDALREFRRNLASIAEASSTEEARPEGEAMPEEGEVEHVQEGDDTEMQAVGAAEDEDSRQHIPEQEAGLRDEKSEEEGPTRPDLDEQQPDSAAANAQIEAPALPDPKGVDEDAPREDARDNAQDKALLPADVSSAQPDKGSAKLGGNDDADRQELSDDHSEDSHMTDEEELVDPVPEEDREEVDRALEEKLASFRSSSAADERLAQAGDLWRSYSAMTSDLAFALCEQLRLILAPTLAARLNGDFRTGKRLNMRKIVPFIASDFAKDKIWLRRTKPSKREYQVLLALDDSRSMAENRSVHLAYQTLALVTGALSRLEVGDVSVCRFGEQVRTLHPFGKGALGDANGGQVIDQLSFEQKGTNMVRLLEQTLVSLREARESRPTSSGSSAADLWQLQIIISDGVCQADDFERLRALLRRANEERVMIVFIIVDSMQQRTGNKAGEPDSRSRSANNSVLSMQSVRYEVDPATGKFEMKMERYMDQFPFSHYVILREAEALPDVLATTLRQWAERIRESE